MFSKLLTKKHSQKDILKKSKNNKPFNCNCRSNRTKYHPELMWTNLHDRAYNGTLTTDDIANLTTTEINICDEYGHSALFCAVLGNQYETVVMLLQAGANARDTDNAGRNLFYITENINFVDLFLAYGVDHKPLIIYEERYNNSLVKNNIMNRIKQYDCGNNIVSKSLNIRYMTPVQIESDVKLIFENNKPIKILELNVKLISNTLARINFGIFVCLNKKKIQAHVKYCSRDPLIYEQYCKYQRKWFTLADNLQQYVNIEYCRESVTFPETLQFIFNNDFVDLNKSGTFLYEIYMVTFPTLIDTGALFDMQFCCW